MKKKRYDVIIVGAGVAGLMLAKLMNNSKLDVLLVEKRPSLKKMININEYGTFFETVKRFKLESCVTKKYKKFIFYCPNQKVSYSYGKTKFAIVDMSKFLETLKLMCDVKTNTTVIDVTRNKGGITIIDNHKNAFEAKILVDCSGDAKFIARKAKSKKSTLDMYDRAYRLKNCNLPYSNAWSFITDLNYANIGFTYYPISKRECILIHTDFTSKEFPLLKNQERSIDYFMQNVEPYKTWFKNAKIVQEYRKIGPTCTEISSIVEDNVIICGDAAGAGSPFIGEGFRIALEMAKSAKDTILYAFKQNDFSRKTLILHKKSFDQMFGQYYGWSYFIRFLLLRYWTNEEFDLFAQNIRNKIDNETSMKVLKSEFTFKILLKFFSLGLIYKTALNSLKYTLNGFQSLNKRVMK